MPVYKSIKSYRQAISRKITAIKKSGDKSSKESASYLQNQAKKLAPIHKGNLVKGIKKRKKKDGQWFVESRVPGNFPYHFWVNATQPYKTLRMRWNKGQPVAYGKGHNATGVARYFTIATNKTKKQFRRFAKKNTSKALQAK